MSNADRLNYVSNSDNKKDLLPSATSKMHDGLNAAVKHKEKLLEYDRTR